MHIKYIILILDKRLKFLFDKFEVFDDKHIDSKINKFKSDGHLVNKVESDDGICLAILSEIVINDKSKKSILISKYIFDIMVDADPSPNKMYTQWMLTTFNRLLKNNDIVSAIRFATEDLPLAKDYLLIFEANKRKQKFKNLCSGSYILRHITDPTDINQYKSLGQLFDAIDPFIVRDSSEIERLLYKFVDSGQAEIGVRDRKFTVYIPLTRDASTVFDQFANWCTCKEGNGMFNHYTSNNKRPNGEKSKIYIIINNDFFSGKLDDEVLHQIHFETNQIKHRKNTTNVSIYDNVLLQSESLLEYFHDELVYWSKKVKSTNNNLYLDYLVKFGFSDSLFEVIEESTPFIIFKDKELPKMGDLTRFKNLEILEINNSNLVSLHPSIFSLTNLEVMVVRDNRLTEIPKEISNLRKLIFINLMGNKISNIPDSIKYLDKSNGGNLHRLAVSIRDIGEANYNKLKALLPNVVVDPQ